MSRVLISSLVCLLLVLEGAQAFAAPPVEMTLGGRAESSIAVPLRGSDSFAWFSFSPLIVGGGGLGSGGEWALRLAPEVQASTLPAHADLEPGPSTLRLRFPGLDLEGGWLLDQGRAAELFPQTLFFGPSDPLSRFETGGAVARRLEEALAVARVYGDWWRLSASLAPWRPPLVLSRLDSPWFPSSLVPSTVSFAGQTYTRRSLVYAVADQEAWVYDPSFVISCGFSLGPLDLDLYYFQGLERNPVVAGDVILGTGLGYSYDVELKPERAELRTLASSATVVLDNLRLWEESAWSWGASLASGSVSSPTLNPGRYYLPGSSLVFTQTPPVLSVGKLGLTGGLSWSLALRELSFAAFGEVTCSQYFGAPAGTAPPLLSRAFGGGLSLTDAEERFGLETAILVSLKDHSFVIRPSAHLALGSDRELMASLPLFFGDQEQEFGRYADSHNFILSLSQRF